MHIFDPSHSVANSFNQNSFKNKVKQTLSQNMNAMREVNRMSLVNHVVFANAQSKHAAETAAASITKSVVLVASAKMKNELKSILEAAKRG